MYVEDICPLIYLGGKAWMKGGISRLISIQLIFLPWRQALRVDRWKISICGNLFVIMVSWEIVEYNYFREWKLKTKV